MDIKSLSSRPPLPGLKPRTSSGSMGPPSGLILKSSESVHRTDDPDSCTPADRLKFAHPEVLSVQKSLEMENATVFDRFEKWLIDNGAKFPGLYFKMYGPDQRGVHCKQDIDRNRRIMYVPLKCLITDQMARQTKTGQLLISIEKRLSAPNHNQIIVFMLEDMMKKDSFFKPYYDILPKDVTNFPVFWTDKEVGYLKGSTLSGEIQQRREKIRNDYNIIGGLIPGFFDNFTFEKFLWCRTIVGSRNFTITIDGSKRTSMVPQADMLNHYRPRETSWTFENDIRCFTITSLKPLKRGQQVMDSYGKKCNSKFLLHYGFAVELNREANGVCLNKIALKAKLRDEDPALREKLFLSPRQKKVNVSMSHQSKETREALGFMRIVVATPDECRVMGKNHVGVVSVRNEVAAIKAVAVMCENRLKGYPTSWEEDKKRLQTLKPFTNERNALVVIAGEKEICHMWIRVAREIAEITDKSSSPTERTKRVTSTYSGRDDDVARFVLSLNRSLILRGC